MKINKPFDKRPSSDSISDITPIKDGTSISNSNTKSIFKFRREDDDSSLYSNKEDLLSLSSEDIETKMNKLIDIKKKTNNGTKPTVNSKKELNTVNKFLRTSIQKKTTKKFLNPIIPTSVVNTFNNENNRREETKDKTNEEKKTDEKNIKKIKSKTKKLELLKRRKKEYLDLIGLQVKRRELEMKNIEEKINKQNVKYSKLYDGESISNTESIISEINPNLQIENGFELLIFIFKNNLAFKKLYFIDKLENFYKNKEVEVTHPVRNEKKRRTQKLIAKKNSTREKDKKEIEKEQEKEKAQIEEIEEYSLNEENEQNDETFINLHRFKEMDKPVDKSQLVEYDLFYKEQFFKDEVFKYDVENIEDKEEKEINKEMNKLDCKRRLTEKKKLKEVNDLKGLDTTDLEHEIKVLTKEYEKIKKKEEPKVN